MITRRALIAAGACLPFVRAYGQPRAGKVARIGVLIAGSSSGWTPMVDALREGLAKLGYVEGKNVSFLFRWAEEKFERLPALARELVQAEVDVIVSHGTAGVRAAQQSTTTIPIVMASNGDPVHGGFIKSLARPGGNTTGLALLNREIAAKRLELLRETLPRMQEVALLTHASTTYLNDQIVAAAAVFKFAVRTLYLDAARDMEKVLAPLAKSKGVPLLVCETPITISNGVAIGQVATRLGIASAGFTAIAEHGLLAYGPNIPDTWRQSARFIDKILKGANAGDIPVEQPMRFDLVVNQRSAKALGLKVPSTIMVQATRVIE